METIVTLNEGGESVDVVPDAWWCCFARQGASTYKPPTAKTAHRVSLWDFGISDFHTRRIGMSSRRPSVMTWGIELSTEIASWPTQFPPERAVQ